METPSGRTRNWPTLVLEVTVSESAGKLMSDVKYWLCQAEGAVQAILSLKADRRHSTITVEKRVRNVETRHPQRDQSIVIRKCNTSVAVQGAPLRIEFDKVILCQPEPPREHDVLLDREELTDIATGIWVEQGFCTDENERL